MADIILRSKSGEQFSISGQITKPVTAGQSPPWPNYPSNATGHVLKFTAKRKKTDAAALVQKTGSLANGGAWTVTIDDTDTHDFTKAELLAYDVTLVEPDGTQTVVSEGTWEVEKSVGL